MLPIYAIHHPDLDYLRMVPDLVQCAGTLQRLGKAKIESDIAASPTDSDKRLLKDVLTQLQDIRAQILSHTQSLNIWNVDSTY